MRGGEAAPVLANDLITWYLFFGGLGTGLYLVAYACERIASHRHGAWTPFAHAVWLPSLVLTAAALTFGALCLLKDLGRSSDAYLLFLKPTLTPISIGAFSLIALAVLIVACIAMELRGKGSDTTAFRVVKALSAATALIVALYTGILLAGIAAVPLWSSPLLPALFLLSALSTGIAAVLIVSSFASSKIGSARTQLAEPDRALIAADCAVIVGEIVLCGIMALALRDNAAALVSMESLAIGSYAGQFWLGFAACGLIIPLSIEVIMIARSIALRVIVCCTGASVIIGGFFLRYCLMQAGTHLSLFMFAGL